MTIRVVKELVEVEPGPDLYDAFAVLQDLREGQTRQGKPFLTLQVADRTSALQAKIWSNEELMKEARELALGSVVKVRFSAETYNDRIQLKVSKFRPIEDGDDYDHALLFGEGYEIVRDRLCTSLVFDIETVPAADRRSLPQTIAGSLAKHAERMDSEEATVMGMSPFFGKVVSLAFGDAEDDPEEQRVSALVVPPEGCDPDGLPDWMIPVTELELLQAWWVLAATAKTVISFNGRGFDVPFLVGRSLVHAVPARVDLLANRYSLRPHLDLYRALTHGERALGPSSLDVVCWGLGIESPKGEMDGSMVAPTYERGEIEKIAEYNVQDVRATTAVYRILRDGSLRFREDW